MKVYVVVPVHNRAPITARFLASLREQTFGDYRLLLVDDGCTDDTVAIARQSLPAERLHVLRGDGNLWWAGALQMAYEHLRLNCRPDDAVLLVNDDVTFDPQFLWNGMRLLTGHPEACIQAVSIDRRTGAVVRGVVADVRRLHFRGTRPGEQPNCLATRGLLMSGATFRHSGGFRPRWLPHYLSDYEYTLRLNRQGVPLLCVDEFSVEFDAEATGDATYSNRGLRDFWTRSFSNRAKYNPMHWSAFVMMVCPMPLVPCHLIMIWLRFTRALVRNVLPDAVANR